MNVAQSRLRSRGTNWSYCVLPTQTTLALGKAVVAQCLHGYATLLPSISAWLQGPDVALTMVCNANE